MSTDGETGHIQWCYSWSSEWWWTDWAYIMMSLMSRWALMERLGTWSDVTHDQGKCWWKNWTDAVMSLMIMWVLMERLDRHSDVTHDQVSAKEIGQKQWCHIWSDECWWIMRRWWKWTDTVMHSWSNEYWWGDWAYTVMSLMIRWVLMDWEEKARLDRSSYVKQDLVSTDRETGQLQYCHSWSNEYWWSADGETVMMSLMIRWVLIERLGIWSDITHDQGKCWWKDWTNAVMSLMIR